MIKLKQQMFQKITVGYSNIDLKILVIREFLVCVIGIASFFHPKVDKRDAQIIRSSIEKLSIKEIFKLFLSIK